MGASPVLASGGKKDFYEAYYLEVEKGDLTQAAELYARVADSRDATSELRAQARLRLESCREELAGSDFARLMPRETLAYVELSRPGDQVAHLLRMLGLTSDGSKKIDGKHIAVSPKLIEAALGIRGAAIGITGFDAANQIPVGVGIFHPGSVDLVRGAIETGLPVAADPIGDVLGYPTYRVEGKVYVTLTQRMVIVSPQKAHIEGTLKRLKGETTESLADHPRIGEVLATRDDSMLFFCVNAKPVIPMLMMAARGDDDLAMAAAILDFKSLNWVTGRAGVGSDGVFADINVSFDKGHHNLAYNLVRTPPITRDTLSCVPAGSAAFFAAALSPAGGPGPYRTGDPSVTGLDIGREIFANIIDLTAYVIPPSDERSEGASIPDAALVIRVRDPQQSDALWTQLLGLASLGAGAPTMDGSTEQVSGVDVRKYRFPEGVSIHFATNEDRLFITTTRSAMASALVAARGKDSVLTDPAYATALSNMTPATSKAIMVHPGRCLELARPFMSPGDLREVEPFRELMTDLVATAVTDEAEELFRASLTVTGLPKIDHLVADLLQARHHHARAEQRLFQARSQESWQDATAAVDQLIAADPHNVGLYQSKFEMLAKDKKDSKAAHRWAERLLEAMHEDAGALNNTAWDIMTNEDYEDQYTRVALEMAERACELTQHDNWAFVDTLALAKFKIGKIREAVRLQERAIELHGGDDDDLKAALKKYTSALN
jgi:hypothetical protein